MQIQLVTAVPSVSRTFFGCKQLQLDELTRVSFGIVLGSYED